MNKEAPSERLKKFEISYCKILQSMESVVVFPGEGAYTGWEVGWYDKRGGGGYYTLRLKHQHRKLQ